GRAALIPEDKAGDRNISTGADKSARADVSQFSARLIEIVNFDKRHAGPWTVSPDDCGVIPRRKGRIDGRFKIVHGRNACRLYTGFLSIAPVVVKGNGIRAGMV